MRIIVDEAGLRLDAFLSDCAELSLSRSYLKKLIDNKNVKVNGKEQKASYKLSLDDEIELELPEAEELNIAAENIPLDIVYEDEDLMVINKPIGMVVHPAPGLYSGTLVNAILHHAGSSLSDINGVLRPGIVHRLDKDTSGLIVVAKNNDAHQSLTEQIQNRKCKRIYRAIVEGKVKEDKGQVNQSIGRDPKDRKRMAVTSQGKVRSALTRYKVLERFVFAGKNYTYVQCELETGRTHQIRVHMSWLRHPIVGDFTYGASKKNSFKTTRPMLHAGQLSFNHPKTEEYSSYQSENPQDFQGILDILRSN